MGDKSTVLIIEDDKIQIALMQHVLAKGKVAYLSAASGQEALQLAEEHTGEIGLILMDLSMPQMNGLEVHSRLRELPGYQDIPVVAVTAQSFELAQQAVDAGMSEFLSKPFSPNDILELIKKYMG